MADETRSAEVQLTADISGYTQPIGQATQQTNKLTDSVNKLVASLDGITKRAGKKLLIFSAADAAAMTAYTAAAAKYEKQLTTLRAQTELSGKSLTLYKKGIEDIARQMPITGAAVTALVTQINQLGVTSERQATQMARTFTQLAAATGEDIGALTQGLIELSRQMGTLGNGAQGIANFADSLTTVSNSAGVSATAVLSFSQAIAPMARAAGIGQKEVLGISTAFTKAGADGFAAANTFNTMVNDITRQVMSGSPEIGKYAAAIGTTIDQFKQMAPVERVVALFEAINKAGPDSVKMLDRLGYDGIRAAKSIQAVAAESGGLRKAIQESIGAYGSGSTAKGAEAAFSSMDAAMTRFRNNLEQIAATIGSTLLPVATAFMNVLNKGLEVVNQMAGPLLQVAGAITGILAPLSAAFGGLLTMMGPLSQVMLAMTAFRLSPMRAMIQGVKEGANRSQATAWNLPYAPTTNAGMREAGIKGDPLKGYQRAPFMWGQAMGSRLPVNPPGTSRAGQWLLTGGITASNLARTWYTEPTTQMIRNAGMADPFDRVSATGNLIDSAAERSKTLGGTIRQAFSNPLLYIASRRGGPSTPGSPFDIAKINAEAAAASEKVMRESGGWGVGGGRGGGGKLSKEQLEARAAKAAQDVRDSYSAAAKAAGDETAARRTSTKTVGELTKSLGALGRSAAGLPIAYGMMGGRLAGQGAMALGRGALGSLGSMVGLSGGAVAGIGAVAGLGYLTKMAAESTQSTYDSTRNITATNEALGIATEPLRDFSSAVMAATDALRDLTTARSGFALTSQERTAAMSREFVDARFADLRGPDQIRAYVQSMGALSGEQARSVGMDAYKALGGSDAAYKAAMQGMGTGGLNNFGIQGALLSGALATQGDTWHEGLFSISPGSPADSILPDWLTGSPFADNGTKEQINAAVAAMQTEANDAATRYGDKAGGQTLAARMMEAADTLFKGNTTTDRVAQQNWLASVEQAFLGGEDIGVGLNVTSGRMNLSGVDITGGESLMKALAASQSGSNARSLYSQLFGANVSSTSGASSAIADIIASGAMSPTEAKVRSTALGEFSRTNKSVLEATVGAGTGDPKAIDAAMEEMLGYVTKNGTAFDDSTKSLQEFKKNLEDTSDFTYTLAQAVQAAAERMGGIQARREGGYFGNLGYRIQTTQSKIDNPDLRLPGESTDTLRQQMEGLEQEVIDKKIEAYQTIKGYNISFARQEKAFETSMLHSRQDFHRSMVYAEEDFARSMRRASEDAAKSIYDPMQRVFNGNTMSVDQFINNQKDQNKKIQQQLKDVAALRKMGVSQQAIDMYGLDDAQNYALTRRFVDGGMSGRDIRQMNQQAGRRQQGTTANMNLQDTTRRAVEDQGRMMDRQYEQFEINMDRSRKAMERAQRQALWDLQQYGKDLVLAEAEIDVKLQEQVNTALGTARTKIRGSINDDALFIMEQLGIVSDLVDAATKPKVKVPKGAQIPDEPSGASYPTGDQDYGYSQYDAYNKPDSIFNPRGTGRRPGVGPRQPAGTAPRVATPHAATGGVVKDLTLAVLGEMAHPEMIVPLHGPEGKAYITQMAAQITTHMVKGMHTSGKGSPTVYRGSNMTINNHTEFRDIKVVAQDPNEMARKLKEKERMENLRKGANARA